MDDTHTQNVTRLVIIRESSRNDTGMKITLLSLALLTACSALAVEPTAITPTPVVKPATAVKPLVEEQPDPYVFPEKLAGDDFDGTPCLITFSSVGQGLIKRLTDTKKYGEGSPSAPFHTLAKVYFKQEGNRLLSSVSCDRQSPDFKNFPGLDSNFHNSVNVGLGLWRFGKRSYSDSIKFFHEKSEEHDRPDGLLESEQKYKAEQAKKRNMPPGLVSALCAFRIDAGESKLLIFASSSDSPMGVLYYARTFIWDGVRWTYFGSNKMLNNMDLSCFRNEFDSLARSVGGVSIKPAGK